MPTVNVQKDPYVAISESTQNDAIQFFHFYFNKKINGSYYTIDSGAETSTNADGSISYDGIRVSKTLDTPEQIEYLIEVNCVVTDPSLNTKVKFKNIFKETVTDGNLRVIIRIPGVNGEDDDDDVIEYEDMPIEHPVADELTGNNKYVDDEKLNSNNKNTDKNSGKP